MRKRKLGDITRWHDTDQWYVVEKFGPRRGAIGRCFHGGRVGRSFRLGGQWMKHVPEANVPDRIWAALATWRLTS